MFKISVAADLVDGINRKMESLYRDHLHKVGFRWFEIGVLLGVPIFILKDNIENLEHSKKKIIEVIKVNFRNHTRMSNDISTFVIGMAELMF